MKILIIDPIGGISGDMLLGSLVHLGCPIEYLHEIYSLMPVGKFTIHTLEKSINNIAAIDLKFETGHEHKHRTFERIRKDFLGKLPGEISEKALNIFTKLAHAEAEVHGVSVDKVHFHEVGALDSILDIVGIAAALHKLGIDAVYSRVVPLGTGTTKSMHGVIPVPVPATVKLLEGRRVRFTGIDAELTTPTGAAVISALAHRSDPPSDLVLKGVGYGCGDRNIQGWPNLCRAILCEVPSHAADDVCYMVEADVDDMTPEEYESATSRIVDAGALDVSVTPRIMKKGRPGQGVRALCPGSALEDVLYAILEYTTSIGVRYYAVSRRILARNQYAVETRYGPVEIKEVVTPSGGTRFKPEFRDIHAISKAQDIPLADIRAAVETAVKNMKKE